MKRTCKSINEMEAPTQQGFRRKPTSTARSLGSVSQINKILNILLGLLLCGCGDPYTSSYTQSKPLQKDLIGLWLVNLKNSRVPFSLETSGPAPKLILHEDGSFEASDLPGKAFHEAGGVTSISGKGEWKLEKHQEWWIVRLNWRERSDGAKGIGGLLHIRNQQKEYLLHCTIGDPDEGDAVAFARE